MHMRRTCDARAMRVRCACDEMKGTRCDVVQDVVADAMPALVERVKAAHTQYTRIPGTPRTRPQTDAPPEEEEEEEEEEEDCPPVAAAASSSAAPMEDKQRWVPGASPRQSADTAVAKLQQEVRRGIHQHEQRLLINLASVRWAVSPSSRVWGVHRTSRGGREAEGVRDASIRTLTGNGAGGGGGRWRDWRR